MHAFQHWISLLKYFLYLSSLETLSFSNSFSDWFPNHIFIHLGVIQRPTKITGVSLLQRRAQLCKGNGHSWSSRSCMLTTAQWRRCWGPRNFDFLWYRSSHKNHKNQKKHKNHPHCTVFPKVGRKAPVLWLRHTGFPHFAFPWSSVWVWMWLRQVFPISQWLVLHVALDATLYLYSLWNGNILEISALAEWSAKAAQIKQH